MRTIVKAAVVASMVLAVPAATAEPIVGGGYADCSVLLENNAFTDNHANMQWLLGYLSGAAMVSEGMNRIHNAGSRLPGRVTSFSTGAHVVRARELCQRDPSDKLWQVATTMMIDLGR